MRVTNIGAKLARRLRINRKVKRSIGATAILAGSLVFAGPVEAQLFSENFDSLPLMDAVSLNETFGTAVWTDVPPAGWTRDNTTTPVGGPAEFFGFTFVDKDWWITTAGDQNRGDFTRGSGTVAVADGDEYADAAEPGGAGVLAGDDMNVFLQTPAISLAGVAPGTTVLNFDSSFRPYAGQTGLVDVSFDGGTTFNNVLTLDTASIPGGNSSLVRANENVVLPLSNPAGASSLIVRFGYTNADNDWWWAIDNLQVLEGDPTLSIEVNRNTGGIALQNNTTAPVDIAGYTITSAAGSLSFDNWDPIAGRLDAAGDGTIDSDGNWTALTLPGQSDNLAEASLDAADDAAGGTIGQGVSINLAAGGAGPAAGGWLKSPTEDLVFQYISGGEVVDGLVSFVGNDDMPYALADFDVDGDVDSNDWAISRDNQRADMSLLSLTEAYHLGDLTGDKQNNHADFVAFKQVFDAQNGAGSFVAMLQAAGSTVPEPGTMSILVLGGTMLAWGFRKRK